MAVVLIIVLILVCMWYHMQPIYTLIILIAAISALPLLIMSYYSQKQDSKRFNDIDVYLHQMAYSFQRNPKINIALSDTKKVVSTDMQRVIGKAQHRLEYGDSTSLYEEALEIIADSYNCPRIRTLHKFLISIEEKGGNYYNSLKILTEDFDRWVRAVYKYQQEIQHIKTNSFFGVIISLALASASILISSILQGTAQVSMDITNDLLYQVVSLVFIILNMIYCGYVFVQYGKNWINIERGEDKIIKDYNMVFNSQDKSLKYFRTAVVIAGTVAAVIIYLNFNRAAGVVTAIIANYLAAVPAVNRKNAFSRLKQDVYISFSEWLRDVTINLQNEPLQTAIENTYENCPAILKNSLGRFIYELEENPTDIMPYYNFMNEFEIMDISSTVKTLYSVYEMDSENSDIVLNELIKRNYEIVDKHEELDNRDKLSLLRFAEYIPMMFVSLKMSADMLLIIINYL